MKAILPDSDPHCSFSVCFDWFSDSIYIYNLGRELNIVKDVKCILE